MAGEELLNGKMTLVYSLKNDGKSTRQVSKIWIDAKSNLPVRITDEFTAEDGKEISNIVRENYKWNEPVNAKLFALEAS